MRHNKINKKKLAEFMDTDRTLGEIAKHFDCSEFSVWDALGRMHRNNQISELKFVGWYQNTAKRRAKLTLEKFKK